MRLQRVKDALLKKIGIPFYSAILPRNFFFIHKGTCSCCDTYTTFYAYDSYLRSSYFCAKCKSLPRERAIMQAIERYYPNWKELAIHEAAPIERGASLKMMNLATNYLGTQYYPNESFGSIVNGFRNEDLESQTFKDQQFDLVITQDIFEHLYNPEKAFSEIHRTLKIGGAHILTVPIENKFSPTVKWAKLNEKGENVFLHKPEYHGNPADPEGSPVTWHYGYDIMELVKQATGVDAIIETWDDFENGIKGELLEVIVIQKN